MDITHMNRRDMLALGLLTALPGTLLTNLSSAAAAAGANSMKTLDRFIAGYCAAMNAPGLTLGLANADGPLRVAAYGYVDLAAKTPVLTSHLFEIGSISKSFVALVILQLHEAGKLDLQAPIRGYLPWLSMETDFGDILVHHLLTHSSGMPEDAPLFPSSPQRRPRQAFKPGSEFHYSNWGYGVLGRLIESLDGRPWPLAVRKRILQPLGMFDTAPAITSAVRPRIAQSYVPLHDDRPYLRHGPLVPAGNLAVEFAAGSIASTPRDMTLYMQMLLNHGAMRAGRIISEDSFKLMSTHHIDAPQFGPGAGYGYGIAVDNLDGHVRLRHTGGMVSFMSAMHLDLDARFGAFASINAQLGYRPNPVAQLALQLLRAERDHDKPPVIPEFDAVAKVLGAQSYAGIYVSAAGRRIEVTTAAERLALLIDNHSVPLQQSEDGSFISDHPPLALFPIVFERDPGAADQAESAVIALAHGSDWYVREGYQGQASIAPSSELSQYEGKFYSEDPWFGVVRVVQRQGKLWLGGTDVLVATGNHLFRIGAQPTSPSVAEFSERAGKVFNLLWIDGVEFLRVADDTP